MLAILQQPILIGLVLPNAALAAILFLLKLFDAWSTNYIVGRKSGEEKMSLALWLIKVTGSVQGGLAIDFAIVAVAGWIAYPYWQLLAGLVAWYGYWMGLRQYDEFKKSKPK